jgi:hypothetical protein
MDYETTRYERQMTREMSDALQETSDGIQVTRANDN